MNWINIADEQWKERELVDQGLRVLTQKRLSCIEKTEGVPAMATSLGAVPVRGQHATDIDR